MRAPCNDCGKDTRPVDANGKTIVAEWDEYIVRPEVWRAAGMGARGFLCTPCLSKRLGRKLTAADYLARPGGVGADGKLGFITTKVDALRIVALEEAAR